MEAEWRESEKQFWISDVSWVYFKNIIRHFWGLFLKQITRWGSSAVAERAICVHGDYGRIDI